jgi:hypothetical protein
MARSAKSPGPPAKRGGAVPAGGVPAGGVPAGGVPAGGVPAGGASVPPAMPKFSIKVAAGMFWLFMAAAVTVDKGDKWKFFVTSGVAFACLRCLYDLDEKDPNHKYYVVVFVCIAAGAFWVFDMFPHFANYKEFGKKLASTHPVMEEMYALVKENIDEFIKDNPEAGMAPVEHDTYMQLVLAQFKSWEVAENKLFGLF